MTILTERRASKKYIGDGVVIDLPFDFKIFRPQDVAVYKADKLKLEKKLVYNTDYDVTLNPNQNEDAGGLVTLMTPLDVSEVAVITTNAPSFQSTNLINQGGFYPDVINNTFDYLTILIQQLEEKLSRSVEVPITTGDPEKLAEDLSKLLAHEQAIEELAKIIIQIVSVSNIRGQVVDVAKIKTNVVDVSNIKEDVTTVASNDQNVTTVANNINDVNITAINISDVTNFADVYLGKRNSQPTTRTDGTPLETGDLYFDTVKKSIFVYDKAKPEWILISSVIRSLLKQFYFKATDKQTEFKGNDSNNLPLEFELDYLEIFLNGVHLNPEDFTLDPVNQTITLNEPTRKDDELYIRSYGSFAFPTAEANAVLAIQNQIKSLATNLATITAVFNDLTDVKAVATNVQDITKLSKIETILKTLATNITILQSIEGGLSIIKSVEANKLNIDAVAKIEKQIKDIITNLQKLDSIHTALPQIKTIEADLKNIDAVANDLKTTIDVVAKDKSNIDKVANVDKAVQLIANNLQAILKATSGAVQATETTLGVAKIGTQKQVDDGIDDTVFVTPKKLGSSGIPRILDYDEIIHDGGQDIILLSDVSTATASIVIDTSSVEITEQAKIEDAGSVKRVKFSIPANIVADFNDGHQIKLHIVDANKKESKRVFLYYKEKPDYALNALSKHVNDVTTENKNAIATNKIATDKNTNDIVSNTAEITKIVATLKNGITTDKLAQSFAVPNVLYDKIQVTGEDKTGHYGYAVAMYNDYLAVSDPVLQEVVIYHRDRNNKKIFNIEDVHKGKKHGGFFEEDGQIYVKRKDGVHLDIFEYDETQTNLTFKKVSSINLTASYGNSLAINDNYLIVGNPQAKTALVYKHLGIQWQLVKQLTGGDSFGSDVAVTDKNIIVAEPDNKKIEIFDLTYNKVKTITGGTSFGKLIDYSSKSLAIAEPDNSKVNFYKDELIPTTTIKDVILEKKITGEHLGYNQFVNDRWWVIGSDKNSFFDIYENVKGTWTKKQRFSDTRGDFGDGVSIYDNTMVLGSDNGYVRTYDYDGGSWIFRQELIGSGGFGISVSIYKDTLVVGANGGNYVEIWQRVNNVWSKVKTLNGSGEFGFSVSIYKDTLVVGARNGNYVEIWQRVNNVWTKVKTLNGSGEFGYRLRHRTDKFITVGSKEGSYSELYKINYNMEQKLTAKSTYNTSTDSIAVTTDKLLVVDKTNTTANIYDDKVLLKSFSIDTNFGDACAITTDKVLITNKTDSKLAIYNHSGTKEKEIQLEAGVGSVIDATDTEAVIGSETANKVEVINLI